MYQCLGTYTCVFSIYATVHLHLHNPQTDTYLGMMSYIRYVPTYLHVDRYVCHIGTRVTSCR